MEEFIKKWSNWWMFNKHKKELDLAFEKELKDLIAKEIELRNKNLKLWNHLSLT